VLIISDNNVSHLSLFVSDYFLKDIDKIYANGYNPG